MKGSRGIWSRGFTLIELLIVVAIIAILAAIALVNFQKVATRTKVSRVKSDFRAVATGMEAYIIDNGRYPYVGDKIFLENRIKQLTTPIAYLTRVMEDPFGDEVEFSYIGSYEYRVYDLVTDSDSYHQLLFTHPMGWGYRQNVSPQARWYVTSQGPDTEPNPSFGIPTLFWLPYDPTNGTLSEGDLFLAGPSDRFHGG